MFFFSFSLSYIWFFGQLLSVCACVSCICVQTDNSFNNPGASNSLIKPHTHVDSVDKKNQNKRSKTKVQLVEYTQSEYKIKCEYWWQRAVKQQFIEKKKRNTWRIHQFDRLTKKIIIYNCGSYIVYSWIKGERYRREKKQHENSYTTKFYACHIFKSVSASFRLNTQSNIFKIL